MIKVRRQRAGLRARTWPASALGPALRRGALDKEGAEAVGGVVVVRYGENPLAAIKNVKEKIAEIAPGLPSKTLRRRHGEPGDRSSPSTTARGLIHETLGTLNTALVEEILVTIIVVLVHGDAPAAARC